MKVFWARLLAGFAVILGAAPAFAQGTPKAAVSPVPAPVVQERPPPPIEPSIPVPESPAAAKQKANPPKAAAAAPAKPKRPGKGPTGPVAMPHGDVILMMLRGALASVNQANFTENYAVLHGLTTPTLQARVSAAQFGRAFANLRNQNIDLSPTLVLAPQFVQPPAISPQGHLKLVGFFPTRPAQINFSIDFHPIDGIWMIDAMSVSTTQAAPLQPQALVAPPSGPQVLGDKISGPSPVQPPARGPGAPEATAVKAAPRDAGNPAEAKGTR